MGYALHGYAMSSLGKNLSWYSLVGVWLTTALIALVHSELKWPNCLSYGPLFLVDGLREFRSLSSDSRNYFPL